VVPAIVGRVSGSKPQDKEKVICSQRLLLRFSTQARPLQIEFCLQPQRRNTVPMGF
jgi:hypothetical protein